MNNGTHATESRQGVSQFSQFEELEDLRKAVTREVRCQVNAARYREAVEFKFPKPNSYEPEPEKKAAVMAWGFKHDIGESKDPLIDNVMNSLARAGYWIEYVPGNLDPKLDAACPGRVRSDDPAGWIKANGIELVVLFVARCNEALLELMGDLVIAGIEVMLAGIEGFKIKPVPCTRRYFPNPAKKWNPEIYKIIEDPRRDDSMDKWDKGIPGVRVTENGGIIELREPMAGEWIELKKGVFRWQEPKWTYDELAQSVMPFGKIIMWQPKDYDGMETEKGVPLNPPEGIEYPHELDLEGFKFCEIPARRFDYLVGQSWIYGEFAQKIRAYHAHPVIQAELACFEDRTYDSGLKSDGSGYWDDEKGKNSEQVPYIYTGCQGGTAIKEIPIWLTPRDPFGKPMPREKTKFNQAPKERYVAGLERTGYADLDDPMPENWKQGVPWAFQGQDDGTYEKQTGKAARSHEGRHLGSLGLEDIEESDSLEGEEGTHYRILDESEDYRRKATDPAKWIYNADVHVAKLIEKAKRKALVVGQKARASGDPERIRAAKSIYRWACKEQPGQREQAQAKAERHAWYLAVELLQRLERLQERVTSYKEEEDLDEFHRKQMRLGDQEEYRRGAKGKAGKPNKRIKGMFDEWREVGLEITPLLSSWLNNRREGGSELHHTTYMIAGMSGWRITHVDDDGSVWARKDLPKAEMSMIEVLRDEYRKTREALKALSAELRKDAQVWQLGEVLHEHPEQLLNALKRDWGLTLWTLRENRDIPIPDGLLKEAKAYHKEQVKRFPELWTKRGTRRKHPAHEKAGK